MLNVNMKVGVVAAACSLALVAAPAQAGPTHAARPVAHNQAAQPGGFYLNEVSPAARPGQPAWIEIAQHTYQVFLPIALRAGGSMAVQSIAAPQGAQAGMGSLAGYHISDEDGNVYAIPTTLPPVPPNGLVVIVLGTGTDDLDFSDGVATLYASSLPTSTFEVGGDQVALYSSATFSATTLVDFLAWGEDPDRDDENAVLAGLWNDGSHLLYDQGFGGEVALSPRTPNQSFGRYNGMWHSYRAGQSTRGLPNRPPGPMGSTIPGGARIGADTFGVAWTPVPGAVAYDFELATTPAFTHTLVATRSASPGWGADTTWPAGTFHWRARAVFANGQTSGWLGPLALISADPNAVATGNAGPMATLAPTLTVRLMSTSSYRIQRKDTTMLDIGGGPFNWANGTWFGLPRWETQNRWDGPHWNNDTTQTPTFNGNGYDNVTCVRASVAMINLHHGGSISIDRLSYQFFEASGLVADNAGAPEHDMGFNRGIGGRFSQRYLLGWALGVSADDIQLLNHCPDPVGAGINGFDDEDDYTCPTPGEPVIDFYNVVKALIDMGKPFASVNLNGAHMRVVDGYRIGPNGVDVHVVDPVPNGSCEGPFNFCTRGARWESWSTFANTVERTLYYRWSLDTLKPRFDEPSLWMDSDGDGVNTFDELVRFRTNPHNRDTDGDGLDDKTDIASYTFRNDGTYFKLSADIPYNPPDGLRMEVDWDNDNDGSPDGCEDKNWNGIFEPGESSNFNPAFANPCRPAVTLIAPPNHAKGNIGPINQPGLFGVKLHMGLPPALPNKHLFNKSQFTVTVAQPAGYSYILKPAPIVWFAQQGNYVYLTAQAPTQTTPGLYHVFIDTDWNKIPLVSVDALRYGPIDLKRLTLAIDTSRAPTTTGLTALLLPAVQKVREAAARVGGAAESLAIIATGGLTEPQMVMPLTWMTDTRGVEDGLTAFGAISPTGRNLAGSALLAAQAHLSANPGSGGTGHIILVNATPPDALDLTAGCAYTLTDGVAAPCFPGVPGSDPAGGVFSNTVIHSVMVGPASEAHHLAAGIASGEATWVHAPSITPTVRGVAGELFRAIERATDQQRLLEAGGALGPGERVTHTARIDAPAGAANFMAVFEQAGPGDIEVYRPGGARVLDTDPDADTARGDHFAHLRLSDPTPGVWLLVVKHTGLSGGAIDYLATLSADTTRVDQWIAPHTARPGQPAPLMLGLRDTAPVTGALVTVTVVLPDGLIDRLIALRDDGNGDDTIANDGVYSGVYTPTTTGPHGLRYVAAGVRAGQPFVRLGQRALVVNKPLAYALNAHIQADDYPAFAQTLANAGLMLDVVNTADITGTDWTSYRGIVIDPGTARFDEPWETLAARNTLSNAQIPVIGLGEGGYALFSGLGLDLAAGVTTTAGITRAQAVDPSANVWDAPFALADSSPYVVYSATSGLRVDLGTAPPTGVQIIGADPDASQLSVIARENGRYTWWGFQAGPAAMTETGRRLFVNVTYMAME